MRWLPCFKKHVSWTQCSKIITFWKFVRNRNQMKKIQIFWRLMSNIMHSPFVIVLASALENDVPWSERFHHDYYGDFPPIPQLSLYLTRPLTYISQQWVPCILYVGYHNWWGSCEMMRTIIKTRRVETGLFFSSVANFDWLILKWNEVGTLF